MSLSKAHVHPELWVCKSQHASFFTNQTFPSFTLLQKLKLRKKKYEALIWSRKNPNFLAPDRAFLSPAANN
jgi:hypothetical protein